MSVEQIRQRLRTSQQDFRDDFDVGMEHILQISGTILLRSEFNDLNSMISEFNGLNSTIQIQLACNRNLAIIVQG